MSWGKGTLSREVESFHKKWTRKRKKMMATVRSDLGFHLNPLYKGDSGEWGPNDP
jgi:hypothetical protein